MAQTEYGGRISYSRNLILITWETAFIKPIRAFGDQAQMDMRGERSGNIHCNIQLLSTVCYVFRVIQFYVMLCYVMQRYALCYVMSCCVMSTGANFY